MCQYQKLYYADATGYVIHCQGCNSIQVAFGNIALIIYLPDFYGFKNCIRDAREEYAEVSNSSIRNIAIPTPCEGIKLLLSPIELSELSHMLEEAETELRSQELINLFTNH